MSQNVSVFDLGDAEAAAKRARSATLDDALDDALRSGGRNPASAPPTVESPARPVTPSRAWMLAEWPGLTRTLSLFVPGSGQLVRGETTRGLFLLTSMLFLLSLAWAVLETLDRLVATLEVLGLSVAVVFWTLGAIYTLGGALHLSGALTSIEGSRPGEEIVYHPALTGAASALVPGWGQLLNGDRVRAGLALGSVWLAGAAWIAVSPAAMELLNDFLPTVTPWEQAIRRPGLVWAVCYTFPAVVWALAVYDAATSAAGRR